MVNQHVFPTPLSSDQTLAALWRSTANRLTGGGIIACVVVGAAAVTWSVVSGRVPLVAAVGAIALAFGCYAAVVQPTVGGRWLGPRTQSVMATGISIITALVAVAGGLLVLAALFGGRIEVMRR